MDLLNKDRLDKVFAENTVEAVIHFAGLKAVGESVEFPLRYYQNNLMGTLMLCEVMQKYGVKKIVFSSSASVYGMPERMPITEEFPLQAMNPYGRTKLMIEEILRDIYAADKDWGIVLLRYFNPIGAHESGRIGEDPKGIPNNLMPYLTQVAVGKREKLYIFGNDYPTSDGTGVRVYLHVVDLARGHLQALDKVKVMTGVGYSVLEVVRSFAKATGKDIPYVITERRPGDIAECYADPSKAFRELGWKAEKSLEEMCKDSWRWQKNNPHGYEEREVLKD